MARQSPVSVCIVAAVFTHTCRLATTPRQFHHRQTLAARRRHNQRPDLFRRMTRIAWMLTNSWRKVGEPLRLLAEPANLALIDADGVGRSNFDTLSAHRGGVTLRDDSEADKRMMQVVRQSRRRDGELDA